MEKYNDRKWQCKKRYYRPRLIDKILRRTNKGYTIKWYITGKMSIAKIDLAFYLFLAFCAGVLLGQRWALVQHINF